MGRHASSHAPGESRTPLRKLVALLSSLALVAGMAVVGSLGSGLANADPSDGVYNLTLTGTGTHNGQPVIEDGENASLSFEYNTNAQGKTVTIDFPSGGTYTFNPAVTATCEASNVPSGNDSIDCIGFSGGVLTVTFKSDFAGSGGGVFTTNFKVDGVTDNQAGDVDWAIDGTQQPPIDIIVAEDPGDFAPGSNAFGKTRDNSTLNLNDYITIDASGDPVVIGGKDLADLKVKYTVELVRTAAGDYIIADALDDPLVLDTGSLSCQIVTWDTAGLNASPAAPCSGTEWHDVTPTTTGFSGTATLAGTSKVTLTYTAHPDEAKLLADIDDWLTLGAGNTSSPATYTWTNVRNSATVDSAELQRVATQLQWNKQGVTQGSNSKAVTPTALNSCVTITGDTVDASGCVNEELDYTLTYYSNKTSAGTVTIADALPAGMEYTTGSFAATQAVWTTTPYPPVEGAPGSIAFAPTVAGSPETFSGPVSVPAAPAKTVITYKAKVTDITALQADLQANYDALGAASGTVSSSLLKNTATADGTGIGTATTTVSVIKTGGITPGTSFNKLVDWTAKTVTGDASVKTTDPIAVTYSLSANLGAIESGAPNVVIVDTLPTGVTWDGTVSLGATSTPLTLTKQATCSTTVPATFGTSTAAGTYCIDGATLLINVGNSNTTNAVIDAPATITAGLAGVTGVAAGSGYPTGTLRYGFENEAKFYYGGTNPQSKKATSNLYVRPQAGGEDGYHVDAIFNKTSNVSGELHVNAGDSAEIKYTFTVGAGHDIDARTSTIIDYIDQSVFDLGVGLSNVSVTGTYDGQTLAPGDLSVTQDGDGNLLIALSSPSGVGVVDTRGVDKAWIVTITLHTKPFAASETHAIYNKAILKGDADQATYWSDVTAEATSYGNEWEAQKLVYDANAPSAGAAWSSQVKSLVDRNGELVDNPFVYQIDFIAHGNYGTVGVEPPAIDDLLPAGVHFLGFIDPGIIGTPAVGSASDTSTQPLGGNLEASFDATTGNGKVTLARESGKKFVRSGGDGHYRVYFAVTIDGSVGTNIVNTITGGRTATVEPVAASVSWTKVAAEDNNNLLSGSEWTLVGPQGPDSESLTVTDNGSNDSDAASGHLTVTNLLPGTYTLTETKAPAGYTISGSPKTFVIDPADPAQINVDLGLITNGRAGGGGGGGGGTTTSAPSTTPVTTTPGTPTTPTTPTTSTVPTPNQTPVTTTVPRNECVELQEKGFKPGEHVRIVITEEDGSQYELSGTADENGVVTFCVKAEKPQTLTVEVFGENRHVVREVTIGVLDTVGGLPNTGVAVVTYLGLALLLLAGGGALVVGARRRKGVRH